MKFDKGIYIAALMAVMVLVLSVVAGKADATEPERSYDEQYYKDLYIDVQADEDIPEGDQSLIYTNVSAAGHAIDPIEDVITQQLFAIKSRNADRAFSLTTNDFHKKYEDAKEFLQQVRLDERPLYNYKNHKFLDRHDLKNGLIQKVELVDSRGGKTLIIFKLDQQDAGDWLIDSYTLLQENKGSSI